MYAAPGYFSDSREMDAAYSTGARAALTSMRTEQSSVATLLQVEIRSWAHGDLGVSRQYGVPVSTLLRERTVRSARLLAAGVLLGWSGALVVALPFSLKQTASLDASFALLTAILLAVPVGVLATVCLLLNYGGPVLVLDLVVAARDCKIIHRILKDAWGAPYVFYARAQGLTTLRIAHIHLRPILHRELMSVAVMSFTLALSALVPVEVVFDTAGLGQLAWTAAMNRDLPVLVAVTAVMAACVGLAGGLLEHRRAEEISCV